MRSRLGKLCICIFLSLVCVILYLYVTSQQTQLKKALEQKIEQKSLDGVVLVAKNKRVLISLASGLQSIDQKPITIETQFAIGSLTKQITACALLKLLGQKAVMYPDANIVETVQKLLNLPLSSYLPSTHPIWQNNVPKWIKQVTLHHLLTNTSGIPDYYALHKNSITFFTEYHTPMEIIERIKDYPLQFQPGQGYAYSNTNYFLLGQVIQTLARRPYDEVLNQLLFSPLEMTNTYAAMSGTSTILQKNNQKYASPMLYLPLKQIILKKAHFETDMSMTIGCGNIISTAEDLLKWNIALHITQNVLIKDLYNLLITSYAKINVNKDYGYGISIEHTKYGAIYGHQGNIDSFNTVLMYIPKAKLSVIVLSNLDIADPRLARLPQKNIRGFAPLWECVQKNLSIR